MTKEDLEEEIEAIEAIFPGALKQKGSMYQLDIPDRPISIQLSFPSAYPAEPPHLISVLEGPEQPLLEDIISTTFIPDQVYLFDLIDSIRDTFDSILNEDTPDTDTVSASKLSKEDIAKEIFSHWAAGTSIVDRKSVFIGFACKVESAQEVHEMVSLLNQDKHIARATHNIVAYRIKGSNGTVIQDNDEDGETAAGGRLQHLLELTDVWNVCVCVSRWYGGILLGPDR